MVLLLLLLLLLLMLVMEEEACLALRKVRTLQDAGGVCRGGDHQEQVRHERILLRKKPHYYFKQLISTRIHSSKKTARTSATRESSFKILI